MTLNMLKSRIRAVELQLAFKQSVRLSWWEVMSMLANQYLSTGAGTIADVWHVKERGYAMGIFYLGPLCGPLFAPIVGGALAQRWGWRSTQWFLALYGGGLLMELLSLTAPCVKSSDYLCICIT